MRTKYYLAALALPAMLASCSQDELLVDMPKGGENLAQRPVVGQVTISTDGAATRYDAEKGSFEVGKDVLGLYLMDEYKGLINGSGSTYCPNEHADANAGSTKKLNGVADDVNGAALWAYQDHWFGMYQFVNYIQSNYPFSYVEENGEKVWKNDAKLVEGNYFAMYPQNENAVNRRELWHYINPNVKLVAHSDTENKDGYYIGVENQFFLGYKQIYRDGKADYEGALNVDIKMKGVMAGLKIKLTSWAGNDIILDKISFRNKNGLVLPTLAYIEPQNATVCAEKLNADQFTVVSTKDYYEALPCDEGRHGDGLYNSDATWKKGNIRKLINWSYPGEDGRVPYGLTESSKLKSAYEYSFEFPEETVLRGHQDQGDVIWAYIVLPGLTENDWKNIEPVIYGWQKIIDDRNGNYHLEYGYLQDKNNPNVTFEFGNNITPWTGSDESDYYQLVDARLDNMAWKAQNKETEYFVTSTDDMTKIVEGYLAENASTKAVQLSIVPDANGIEITPEFIESLKKDAKSHDRNITLTFKGDRDGIINFKQDNTLNVNIQNITENGATVKFEYEGAGLKLHNYATQTISYKIGSVKGSDRPTIYNNGGELTIATGGDVYEVSNVATMNVAGKVAYITNHSVLNVNKGGEISGLNNHKTTKVNGNANIVQLENLKYTENCEQCSADFTIAAGATLTSTNIHNYANIEVNGTVTNSVEIINNGKLVNNGTINANGNFENASVIDNKGTINAATLQNWATINNGDAEGKKGVIIATTLRNGGSQENKSGTVNAYAGSIKTLANAKLGVLNVYSEEADVETAATSKGQIIFHDVVAEHVGLASKGSDERVYLLKAATTSAELLPNMWKTASTTVRTAYDITLEFTNEGSTSKPYVLSIEKIEIIGNVTIKNNNLNKTNKFANAKLYVRNGEQLSVENATTLIVKSVEGDKGGKIHTGSNSYLKVSGESGDEDYVGANQVITIDHTNSEVEP